MYFVLLLVEHCTIYVHSYDHWIIILGTNHIKEAIIPQWGITKIIVDQSKTTGM